MFSFITFIFEDEHGLSLGMLMHIKCIHELCILLCQNHYYYATLLYLLELTY